MTPVEAYMKVGVYLAIGFFLVVIFIYVIGPILSLLLSFGGGMGLLLVIGLLVVFSTGLGKARR